MKNKLLKLMLCMAVVSSCSQNARLAPKEDLSYYGTTAHEAEFDFEAYVMLPKSKGQPTDESLRSEVKTVAKYILGKMDHDGAISYGYKTTKKKVEAVGDSYKVTYQLSGRGVFKSQFTTEYEFFVPVAPQDIYRLSKEQCGGLEDGDESSFWYHWNPRLEGCPLVQDTDYLTIKVPLKVIPPTKETYPEYDKLMVNNTLTATLFYGAADHHNKNWNPLDANEDQGAGYYRQTRDFLIELGFKSRQFEEMELREVYNPKDATQLPFAEELTKIGDNGVVMRVRMLFLETGVGDQRSEAFHYFLMRSLKTDKFILYDGHSGLGANLNIDKLEKRYKTKITLSSEYQLLYFGSCVPYAYYSDMFFKRKINKQDEFGTKKLDIFAYGIEAHFFNKENLKVLAALDKYVFTGEKTSYQSIVGETPIDMFGVLGDEDNN